MWLLGGFLPGRKSWPEILAQALSYGDTAGQDFRSSDGREILAFRGQDFPAPKPVWKSWPSLMSTTSLSVIWSFNMAMAVALGATLPGHVANSNLTPLGGLFGSRTVEDLVLERMLRQQARK